MSELPTGTVTFLFTDIEGSTRLLQELGREDTPSSKTGTRRSCGAPSRTAEARRSAPRGTPSSPFSLPRPGPYAVP